MNALAHVNRRRFHGLPGMFTCIASLRTSTEFSARQADSGESQITHGRMPGTLSRIRYSPLRPQRYSV
jgi:hypothetical protein